MSFVKKKDQMYRRLQQGN